VKSDDDLYERLMEARDLLWEAAMELRRLRGQKGVCCGIRPWKCEACVRRLDPQAEVETFDEMNMTVVHRLLEAP
jgi:hypothetical protein